VLVLVLALVALAGCMYVGLTEGDLRRLTSLPDYKGNLCGENGEGPYLYFCKEGEASLDLHHAICVDTCPGDGVSMSCGGSSQKSQQSYATTRFARSLCLPRGNDFLKNQADSVFQTNTFLQAVYSVLVLVSEIEPIGISLVAASILSFLYLALISCCAEPLIILGLFFIIAAPGSVGGVLIYGSQHEDWLVLNGTTFSTGYDLEFGIACCCASALVICVTVSKAASIKASAATVQEASACVMEMPVLLIEPWLSTAFKVALGVPFFMGFTLLDFAGASSEEVDFTSGNQIYQASGLVLICMVVYFVIWCFLFELQHAISQFVTIYAAEVWFFKVQNSRSSFGIGDLAQAFFAAISYHLGSLIYGSLLISALRGPRVLGLILTRAAGEPGNPVSACLATICSCFLGCALQVVEYATNMSYMDIALRGTGYIEGAENAAVAVRTHAHGGGVAFTEGSATIFSIIGVCLVAAGTGCSTWFICTSVDRYSNPESEEHVGDVKRLTAFTVVLGGLVAAPFSSMFDTVADTMVFCASQPAANGFLPADGFGLSGLVGSWFGGGYQGQGH